LSDIDTTDLASSQNLSRIRDLFALVVVEWSSLCAKRAEIDDSREEFNSLLKVETNNFEHDMCWLISPSLDEDTLRKFPSLLDLG